MGDAGATRSCPLHVTPQEHTAVEARFRPLNLSTRMLLSSLAFVLPLAILTWFMEVSFRYDIGIADTELVGTRYIRTATPLFRDISALHRAGARTAQDVPPEGDMAEAARRIEATIADLMRMDEDFDRFVNGSIVGITRRIRMRPHPHGLHQLWNAPAPALPPTPGTPPPLMTALQTLIRNTADSSLITVDPVHDSAHLARLVSRILPNIIVHTHQLGMLTTAVVHAPKSAALSEQWLQTLALIKERDLVDLTQSAAAAIMEDDAFYGASPTLQDRFASELAAFSATMDDVLTALTAIKTSPTSAANVPALLRTATDAEVRLMNTALDELGTLIRLRRNSYATWRTMGLALSVCALAFAVWMVIRTYRSVSVALAEVVHYSHAVSRGNYSATLPTDHSAEVGKLATSIQRMVQQMKERMGYLNGILHGLTVPCVVADAEERLTYVNQPYLDMYDRSGAPEEYVGQSIAEFFYGDTDHTTFTGRAMRERRAFQGIEMSLTTQAGRTIHFRYDVAPIFDLDGVTIGAFSLVTDLTQIREQEREIRRLATFPELNPNPVLAVDATGNISYTNPSATAHIQRLGLLSPRDFLPQGHEHIAAAALASEQDSDAIEHTVMGRTYSWVYHPIPGDKQLHIYAMDITERKRAEEQLQHDAFHDALTGLPNRALFVDRADRIKASSARAGHGYAVLLLDMDGFKNVNDSLGHAMGDRLITQIARRLTSALRGGETLARLGGDEFGVLLSPVASAGDAHTVADRLHEALRPPFVIDTHELFTTASIGIAVDVLDAFSAEDMVRNADIAMYRAKARGQGQSAVFDPTMHAHASQRLLLETEMQRAAERKEFEPFFQPLVDLSTGTISGFEALARWRNPERGLVSPGTFIPLAEENGLILPIGEHILAEACSRVAQWRSEDALGTPDISVNLAVPQMMSPGIVETVAHIIERSGLAPSQVKLEITESGLMSNADTALRVLGDLRNLGVSLAIDDFGTGYSSLAYLTRFPFDFLKVDQSFVAAMLTTPEVAKIVQAIITLAHGLGKKVIAEGIEDEGQLRALRKLGCEFGQGYLFSRPLPHTEARTLLARAPRW